MDETSAALLGLLAAHTSEFGTPAPVAALEVAITVAARQTGWLDPGVEAALASLPSPPDLADAIRNRLNAISSAQHQSAGDGNTGWVVKDNAATNEATARGWPAPSTWY